MLNHKSIKKYLCNNMIRNIHMSDQLKKLFYSKKFIDSPKGEISEWRVSPWKVFLGLLSILILLVLIYAHIGTSEPSDFLGNVVFYSIVIVIAIFVLWVIGTFIWKGRKLIGGFFIVFILLLVFYWFLSFLFGFLDIMEFHSSGYALWFYLTVLSMIGSVRIDGNIDRNDVGFGLLVFVTMIGANIVVANEHGFLWNVDNLINTIIGYIP